MDDIGLVCELSGGEFALVEPMISIVQNSSSRPQNSSRVSTNTMNELRYRS